MGGDHKALMDSARVPSHKPLTHQLNHSKESDLEWRRHWWREKGLGELFSLLRPCGGPEG